MSGTLGAQHPRSGATGGALLGCATVQRMADGERAIRAQITGTVQGVGFRAATVEQATSCGVLGWVRNEEDGAVRVHAEGPSEAVDQLERWLQTGPPGAQVDAAHIDEASVEGHEQFAVRGVPAGRFTVLELETGRGPAYVLVLETDAEPHRWRLSKPPSMEPSERRAATPVDAVPDTPHAPAVWDSGEYEQGGRVPWPEAIDRGHAVFVLRGSRLTGGFALQRTDGKGPPWLLVKRREAG